MTIVASTNYTIEVIDRLNGLVTVYVHTEGGGGAWLSEATGSIDDRNAIIVQAIKEAFE